MTDEEKKAMESLIEIREFANLSSYKDTKINQLNSIDVVLNLIEKQSKEIEELKEKLNKIYNEIDNKNNRLLKALDYKLFMEAKIKANIEKLKEMKVDGEVFTTAVNFAIQELQSLLEKENK